MQNEKEQQQTDNTTQSNQDTLAGSSPPDSDRPKEASSSLGTETMVTPGQTSPPASNGTSPVAKKNKRKLVIVLVVLALLLVGGLVAWMTLANRDSSTNSGNNLTIEPIETLTVGTTQGPASVFFPDEGVVGVQVLLDRQVYEGLVGFENSKPVPLLAESWTNPDQTTWVFKLKPNVAFHTGKILTAKDVKASFDKLKTYDYWSSFVSTIKSIEVTGDLEVTIKTSKPDALLLNRLTQAYISDLEANKPGNDGTGAYVLDSAAVNNEESTTLVAFDNYHGDLAKTRKLNVSIFKSDKDVAQALEDGKVDIAEVRDNSETNQQLVSAGFVSTPHEAPGIFGLYMNQVRNDETIVKNKVFRTAIAQALDRQDLVNELGTNNVVSTQIIPKSLPGYDASISWPEFNLEAAKKSLKESGYNNEPIEFVFLKELQDDAPILIKQLRALGLNVVEKGYEPDNAGQAVADLQAGKFDLFSAAYTSDILDTRDILGGMLHSVEASWPGIEDTDFNNLLAESDEEFDPVKRIAILQEAHRHVLDTMAWVPLRNSAYVVHHKPDIGLSTDYSSSGSVGAYYRKVGRIVN